MQDIEILAPALDGLSNPIFLLDRDRVTLFSNRAAVSMFGHSQTGHDFVHTLRNPECLDAIDNVLAGSSRATAVCALPSTGKTIFEVVVSALNPAKESPGVPFVLVSFTDLTFLHEARQIRSEFVANVSHELRSPLTTLSGYIETLQTIASDDAAARERFLDVMSAEAKRMGRLIADLLSLSKVEANKNIRPQERVCLAATVKQAIGAFSPDQGSAEKPGIVLTVQDGLATEVIGDKDQLLQVFLNLIENALKYGDGTTPVEVSISQTGQQPGLDGAAISIAVSDHGEGIAAEHLSRLTERFYRVDEGRSRVQGGTGLGLAIVKHILTRHRGKLSIASTPGAGSTFTVFLPAADLS